MSDALEMIGALSLFGLVPAVAMLLAKWRQRLIIGAIGIAVGLICQLTFDGNVHQSAPILLGIFAGYCVAVGALEAEILSRLVRTLWSWFRPGVKAGRTAKAARD